MDQQMGEPQQEAMPFQDHQKDGSQEKAKDEERDEPHQEDKDEEEEKPGAHQHLQEGDKDEPHEELQEELKDAPHEEAKDANQEAQEEPKDDPQKALVDSASNAAQDEAEAEGGTPNGVCKLRLVSTNASWPKPRKTLQSSYRKLAGGLLLAPSGTSREAIRMVPDIASMWLCSRVARNP